MGVGLIVLASGGSSRMGTPKQLLAYRGTTLIRHALVTAAATPCRPIVAVLGAARDRIEPECAGLPVEIAVNDAWAEGLASSIRCGINALLCVPDCEAAIIALCDQPEITPEIYGGLLGLFQDGEALAACEYGDGLGAPSLFARRYFPDLLALQGDRGAKPILNACKDRVRTVPFAGAALDVDTPEDYARLLTRA